MLFIYIYRNFGADLFSKLQLVCSRYGLGFLKYLHPRQRFFIFRDNYNTLLIPQLEPFLFRPLNTLCIERCQFNYKVFGSPTKLNLPSLLQSSKNKLKHRLVRSISSACLVGLEPIITKMKITHTLRSLHFL